MNIKALGATWIGLTAILFSSMATANWTLKPELSSIHFVSVKKSKVAEVHSFEKLKGGIDNNGNVEISIDLDSVETLIPIRNERMREMLFETKKFPMAKVTAQIDAVALDKLKVGDSFMQVKDVSLSLHGKTSTVSAELQVVKLGGKQFLITTVKPIIIKLADFDLLGGVEALRAVAKLPSIASEAPGVINLIFSKQ